MNFNFIIPLWGHKVISLFFNYTFKSLFFSGNISELKKYDTTFTFCTFKKDINLISEELNKFKINLIKIKFIKLTYQILC